jgi:hypothetical protein
VPAATAPALICQAHSPGRTSGRKRPVDDRLDASWPGKRMGSA